MSTVLHRIIPYNSRGELFRIVPLGDIHLGNAACNEELFAHCIKYIGSHKHTYWIGMGDYCEFINVHDPRWEPESLAPWITPMMMVDLARAQADRFMTFVKPIASQCLGLVEGNHEVSIRTHFERDIYSDIAPAIQRESEA
jgi:UDP-2,3-diacylglucosamine pyrophosphatase LpxH